MNCFAAGRPQLPRSNGSRFATLALVVLLAMAAEGSAFGIRELCYNVPMRDGQCLPANVFLPRFPKGCYPVLLIRTPDKRETVKRIQARYVCGKGYALVVQDIRGSRPGLGETMVFEHDRTDGHDTLQWILCQPWCNGRVVTWGPSAMGFTQNMLAPDAPEGLVAQHIVMAFSNMYTQVAYQGGAFRKELVEGWLRDRWRGAEQLATLRAHPTYDDFWRNLAPEMDAPRVNTPAVFWGGWHDPFLQGTLNSFSTIQNQGGPLARGNCRLIVGPWMHSQIRGLVDPRKAGQFPYTADALRFFAYWAQCMPNGVPCDVPVFYYVLGDCGDCSGGGNRWKTAANWPPASTPTCFYLAPGGRLAPAPEGETKLSYRYDPADPVPTLGGRNLNIVAGPMDQRPVECRPDVLLFTSDEFQSPIEVTGQIIAKIYAASDCPDTDFTVKVTDVYPDGRSMLVVDGVLRARFREGYDRQVPLEPGHVYQLGIDVGPTAYVFGCGHRIRVAVSSSNSPRFEPNSNTGLPGCETRPAINTIYLGQPMASHVVLPIVRP